MAWVRNRVTGLSHEVPAGHPALSDGRHDVLPEPERAEPEASPEPEAESESEPERKPRRRSSRKKE